MIFAVLFFASLFGSYNAQPNSGSKCKGLQNEGNKFELDESALKLFNNDVQRFFDCCPTDSVVDLSIPELQLDGVLEIAKPVTVEGGGAFIGCYVGSKNEGALVIRSDNVTLRGLSFEGCNLNSTAALIQIENSKNVTVSDLHFSRNKNAAGAPCMSLLQSTVVATNLTAVNNTGIFGGVMSIVNSSSMKIQGSALRQNEAMEQGGALYLHGSDLDASDVWFIENSALDDGGAIFAEGYINSTVKMFNLSLHRNRVHGQYKDDLNWRTGGGVSFLGSGLQVEIMETSFVNNSALNDGGSISIVNGTSAVITASRFIRNHSFQGGAIYAESALPNITFLKVEDTGFHSNYAVMQEPIGSFLPLGGAIALFENGTSASFKDVTFSKNRAGVEGGALSCARMNELNISRSKFLGNVVACPVNEPGKELDTENTFWKPLPGERCNTGQKIGGALSSGAISRILIEGSLFDGNAAYNSGAAEILGDSVENGNRSVITIGGAMYLHKVPDISIVESNFTRNRAQRGGGVIVADATLLIEESRFQDNFATGTGGAMSLTDSNTTIVNSTFTRNAAIQGGGAIQSGVNLLQKGHLKAKEVALKDNYAEDGDGGGLRLLGVDLEMDGSLCQNNSAGSVGGAIYLIQLEASFPTATIKGTSFIGNQADGGGGMYVQQGNLHLSHCAFEANVAHSEGGALFCEDLSVNWVVGNKDSVLKVDSSNFTDNKAGKDVEGNRANGVESSSGNGGAVAMSGLGLNSEFKDCYFLKNLATSGGAMYVQDVRKITLEDFRFGMGEALTGGALTIINTGLTMSNGSFVGNVARFGGAVSFTKVGSARLGVNSTSVASFKVVQFVENVALEGGGAVDLRGRTLECESCHFHSNSAGVVGGGVGYGGAIRALPASKMALMYSDLINCTATQSGGGVFFDDAIFHGENVTIGNNTAIENGGGFAMHFATFAADTIFIPWECRFCGFQGNQAKKGGGLHISEKKTRQPKCQDCELKEVPKHYVMLHSTVFQGNDAEASGSDIFLSNFKNNVCCDDQCWSLASAMKEVVKSCGLGEASRGDVKKTAPVGSFFELLSLSPSAVPNHASGEELPAIKVTPLDSFRQIAVDNLTLRVEEVARPGGDLFGSPAISEGVLMSGVTNVTGIFMRALPGNYNLSIKLTSEDGGRTVTEVVSVEIRECVTGEVKREEGLRCDRCADDFFSFDVSDEVCTPCPVETAKCSGGRLAPLDGFWHSEPRSSQLHACLTKEACKYTNRTDILFASNFNSSGEYPQCAQGYSDVLCGSCTALHGKSRFKCTECQGEGPAGVEIFVVMLALAVLSLIYVKSAAKYSQGVLGDSSNIASTNHPSGSRGGFDLPAFILGEMPDQDAERPHENVHQDAHQNAPPRKSRSSDIFKILVNLFQVTGSAAAINVGWTRSMLMLFASWDSISGVTESTSFFSLECAFSSGENKPPRSIQTSIFLAFVPFMVWAPLVVAHYAHAMRSKKSFREIKLWSCVALLAVQQASYISVTRTLVRIFYCVHVSPMKGSFWVEDTNVGCYRGSHAFLVGFVGAPGLLLVSIGFPGWLLLKLTQSREVLEQDEMVRQYGFLYKAYNTNVAAWEVVILLRKAFLAAIVVFGRTLGEGIQITLALVIMVGSIILQMYFQPFVESKLNFLELGSLTISTLAFIIGNMVDQPKMSEGGRVAMSVVFIGTACIYIVYVLKQIFDVAFVELRERMENTNSGGPLPTSNFALLMMAFKTRVKKTKTGLHKKKATFVKSFSSSSSCEMASR